VWWIKTGSPWIKPTTSDLGAPRMPAVRAHRGRDNFQVREHRCGAGLRLSGVRISRWKGGRSRKRRIAVVWSWTERRTAAVVDKDQEEENCWCSDGGPSRGELLGSED